jgi:hypothetical protein
MGRSGFYGLTILDSAICSGNQRLWQSLKPAWMRRVWSHLDSNAASCGFLSTHVSTTAGRFGSSCCVRQFHSFRSFLWRTFYRSIDGIERFCQLYRWWSVFPLSFASLYSSRERKWLSSQISKEMDEKERRWITPSLSILSTIWRSPNASRQIRQIRQIRASWMPRLSQLEICPSSPILWLTHSTSMFLSRYSILTRSLWVPSWKFSVTELTSQSDSLTE